MSIVFLIFTIIAAVPGLTFIVTYSLQVVPRIWRRLSGQVKTLDLATRMNLAHLIISIVGVVVAIVFGILAVSVDDGGEPPPPTPTSTPTLTATTLPTPTATPLPATPTPCPLVSDRPPIAGPPADLEGEIVSPSDCAQDLPSGGEGAPVRGSYSSDLDGKQLWVLLYPPDLEYYPQSPNACQPRAMTASEGQWVTRATFGQTGVSEQFDILLTVADVDSEASQVFNDWLMSGCETGDFPGFIDLPSGLTELDAITVATKG